MREASRISYYERKEQIMTEKEKQAREVLEVIRQGDVSDRERISVYMQGVMAGYNLAKPDRAPEPKKEGAA